MKISCTLACALIPLALAPAARAQRGKAAFEIPAWAFPGTMAGFQPSVRADTVVRTLPHSSRTFTGAQLVDVLNPPDWYPESHPPAPDAVMHARKEVKYGCGLCHLPDGQGRSENATLAGLPEDYIVRQLKDMRSGARKAAMPFGPSDRMTAIAIAATDSELASAARYFASLEPHRQYRLVESRTAPAAFEAGGLYALRAGAPDEPVGNRLVEVSDDIERHEMRDPKETFTVYVQPGTLSRGRRIALAPKASPTRCATCHGLNLRGTNLGPPIAGRSPLYLLRQLAAFRTKTRNGAASLPMQIVTSKLTLDQMISAVSYAGSLAP